MIKLIENFIYGSPILMKDVIESELNKNSWQTLEELVQGLKMNNWQVFDYNNKFIVANRQDKQYTIILNERGSTITIRNVESLSV